MTNEQIFNESQCLVGSHNGIYTFHVLAKQYGHYFVAAGMSQEDINFMSNEANVSTTEFFEIGDEMEQTIITDEKGVKMNIACIEGDILAIPEKLYNKINWLEL